jgi:hypothetical protein
MGKKRARKACHVERHKEGTLRDERRYHEQFAHLRIRGEWFKDCPEIREHFREMAA